MGFDACFEDPGKDRKHVSQRWKIMGLAALSVVALYVAVAE